MIKLHLYQYYCISFATELMYKEENIMVSSFIEIFFTQGKHFKIGIMMVTKNLHKARLELTVRSKF